MFETPVSGRLHIGIFGKRNTGKSSLINAITGQHLSIVSDVAGTTADPVYKSIEILPIGPCILIDTAGIDDEGALGQERVKQTLKVLRKTDVGLIIVDNDSDFGNFEENLYKTFKEKKLPFLFVINKSDLDDTKGMEDSIKAKDLPYIKVSSKTNEGIEALKKRIVEIAPANWSPVPIVGDLIEEGARVVLVCPIDSAMPQGRLILPQVQVLRDILDSNAVGYVTKDSQLQLTLDSLKEKPDLVITDSQVFEDVSKIVPADIPLTSFSILFARHRGDIKEYIKGAKAVEELKDGDEILIAEACTHHPQPEDIARTKIPTWLLNTTGKELHFDVHAGGDFPSDLKRYKLIVTCGGCMINRREAISRIEKARSIGVPITNYGVLIAYLNGILDRVILPLEKGIIAI